MTIALLNDLGRGTKCDMRATTYYSLVTDNLSLINLEFLSLGVWNVLSRIFYLKKLSKPFNIESVRNFALACNSNLFLTMFFDNTCKEWFVQSIETTLGKVLLQESFSSHEEINNRYVDLKEKNKSIL